MTVERKPPTLIRPKVWQVQGGPKWIVLTSEHVEGKGPTPVVVVMYHRNNRRQAVRHAYDLADGADKFFPRGLDGWDARTSELGRLKIMLAICGALLLPIGRNGLQIVDDQVVGMRYRDSVNRDGHFIMAVESYLCLDSMERSFAHDPDLVRVQPLKRKSGSSRKPQDAQPASKRVEKAQEAMAA